MVRDGKCESQGAGVKARGFIPASKHGPYRRFSYLDEHGERRLGAGVDAGHVHHEVDHAVRVAPLVVVPGNQLVGSIAS